MIEPPLPSNPSDSPMPKASASAMMRFSSMIGRKAKKQPVSRLEASKRKNITLT